MGPVMFMLISSVVVNRDAVKKLSVKCHLRPLVDVREAGLCKVVVSGPACVVQRSCSVGGESVVVVVSRVGCLFLANARLALCREDGRVNVVDVKSDFFDEFVVGEECIRGVSVDIAVRGWILWME